jgi:hypothetical protein
MVRSEAHSACRNCGTPLHGVYCAHCGQHDVDYHRSLRFIIEDALEDFLHLDGKFLNTVRCLFLRPGFLTQELISGRRARYTHPLRLYVFASFLSFLALALVPSKFTAGQSDNLRDGTVPMAMNSGKKPVDTGGLPDRFRSMLNPRALTSEKFSAKLKHLLPGALILCIPMLALLLKMAYAGSHRFYIEHLLFALHLQTLFLLATLVKRGAAWILQPLNEILASASQTIFSVWILFIIYRSFKVVYNQGTGLTLLKAAAVGFTYSAIVTLAVILTMLLSAFIVSGQKL